MNGNQFKLIFSNAGNDISCKNKYWNIVMHIKKAYTLNEKITVGNVSNDIKKSSIKS
ncbi:hypothetical protein [Bacillus cereus group sp. BfR-BA-01403]|uniref:hypothetical protein n=1 Tax=Bacillus cereus group sp. BfR-BA-01403 TaxID=2920336 RepID=UPI001F55E50A|nr:hypothetical protein [Bacillus cereus group sp. BfR-BA-01403]